MPQIRAGIVAEALEWVGTPYHWHGRVKGRQGGVDCAMLLAEVLLRAGAIDTPEVAHYSQQWHLHHDEEKYLAAIERFGRRTATPLPGDCAFFKFGRTYSHGAIVREWPVVIHASLPSRCVLCERADQYPLAGGKAIFYTLFPEGA